MDEEGYVNDPSEGEHDPSEEGYDPSSRGHEHHLVAIPKDADRSFEYPYGPLKEGEEFLRPFVDPFGEHPHLRFEEILPQHEQEVREMLLPRLVALHRADPSGSKMFHPSGAVEDTVTSEDIRDLFERRTYGCPLFYPANRLFITRLPENSQVLYLRSYQDIENSNNSSTYLVVQSQNVWRYQFQPPACQKCEAHEKPHQCNTCDQRFGSKNALFGHLRANADHMTPDCEKCVLRGVP